MGPGLQRAWNVRGGLRVSVMGTGKDGVEPDGFEVFWSRERDRLYRVLAVSIGDDYLAAEAIDEAMARALQRWHRIRGYDDAAGWVLRVARNWATSWQRKWSRRPTRPATDLDREVRDRLPDVDLERGLTALPSEQRIVLALRFLMDWPVAAIATALEVPEGTVKSRLHRALTALGEREEVGR